MADDIWTIVGLSSLIAAVVTVVLGLIRDVLVERYRFKQQSEASYVQRQIQVFSRLWFTLTGLLEASGGALIFKEGLGTFREKNALIEENISLLPPNILKKWFSIMAQIDIVLKEQDAKKKQEQGRLLVEQIEVVLRLLEEVANKNLIPKYRSIVGKTVFDLGKSSQKDGNEDETVNKQEQLS